MNANIVTDILYIWARTTALCLAILIFFGAGGFVLDCVRWGWALGRSRIIRTDLRRSGASCPVDRLLGPQAAPACDGADATPRGAASAHVLDFDSGYTSDRRRLDRLVMSPYSLDGHREESR